MRLPLGLVALPRFLSVTRHVIGASGVLLLAWLSWPATLYAQERQPEPVAVLSVSAVTVHAMGVGLEIRALDRLYVAGRAEGFVGRRKSAQGVGLRADLLNTSDFAVTALGLYGRTSCRRRGESACDAGDASAPAVAAGMGVNFRLGERWSNALEVTWWRPLVGSDEDETDHGRPRLTLGLTLRYLALLH